MDIAIEPGGGSSGSDLEAICLTLKDNGINASEVRDQSVDGDKSLGDVLNVEVIGLALSSVSLLIQALQFWSAERRGYSLSVRSGDVTVGIDDLTESEAADYVREKATGDAAVNIVVSRSDSE